MNFCLCHYTNMMLSFLLTLVPLHSPFPFIWRELENNVCADSRDLLKTSTFNNRK